MAQLKKTNNTTTRLKTNNFIK